jgi:hypothetical protein
MFKGLSASMHDDGEITYQLRLAAPPLSEFLSVCLGCNSVCSQGWSKILHYKVMGYAKLV